MDKTIIHSYKDLIVWQRSIELVIALYELTEKFPKEEMFGITSQMRRASISIPSNIAEGRFTGTKEHFLRYIRIAYASGAELETQIIIAKKLSKTKNLNYVAVDSLLEEVMKMLNSMIRNINPKPNNLTS